MTIDLPQISITGSQLLIGILYIIVGVLFSLLIGVIDALRGAYGRASGWGGPTLKVFDLILFGALWPVMIVVIGGMLFFSSLRK